MAGASSGATGEHERFQIDWGQLDTLRGVTEFVGLTSDTLVSWSYASAGRADAWYLDVVVTGTTPTAAFGRDGSAFVSVFPAGVVSIALPESQAWVDYDGVSLAVFDPGIDAWVTVMDVYRRGGEAASSSLWRRLAYVGLDVASLAVPKVQALKLLIALHDVIEEAVSGALDTSTLWPSGPAFYDPNAYRVVEAPWRFDGSEPGVWDPLPHEGGVVAVRVRVPVFGITAAVVRELDLFVAITEEHSFFQPGSARPPLTGSTAAPVYPPSRLLGRPAGLRSITFHAIRSLERSAWGLEVPLDSPHDLAWVDRLENQRALPRRPDAPGTAAFKRTASGMGFMGVSHTATVRWLEESAGDDSVQFVASIDGSSFSHSDGRPFTSGTDAWTSSFDDGVAYLAIPNVAGLYVQYDAVRLEAYNHHTQVWDEMDNVYAAPAHERAVDRAQDVAIGLLIGKAAETVVGQGVARGVKVVGIAADVAGIAGLAPPNDTTAVLPMPMDRAFYDPNRFRLVEVPWRLELLPYSVRLGEGASAYRNPYEPEEAGMRLRVVVPVRGLPTDDMPHVRAFVVALERVTHWRTTGGIDTATGRATIDSVTSYTRLIEAPSLGNPHASSESPIDAPTEQHTRAPCRALVIVFRDIQGLTSPQRMRDVAHVSIGRYHALALDGNGSIVAWGRNDHGQGSVPAGVPTEPYATVAVGVTDSFAVTRSGTLVAWGERYEGVFAEARPGLSHLDADSSHGVLLFADGTVVYYGSTMRESARVDDDQGTFLGAATSNRGAVFLTDRGLLGGGDFTPPELLRHATDVVRIAAGDLAAVAVHSDGTVSYWGDPWSAGYVRRRMHENVVEAAVGRDFVAFLLLDGRLIVEGYDRFGIGLHTLPEGRILGIAAGYDALGMIYEVDACVP